MTKALDQPAKGGYLVVDFQYGDPQAPDFISFTNSKLNQGMAMSAPNLKVTLPPNQGTFDNSPVTIELPLGVDPWLEAYTEPVAREFVWCRVTEVTRPLEGGPTGTTLVLFNGLVVDSYQNYQGDRVAAFDLLSAKQRLDIPLGIAATHQCTWRLFGRGCFLTESTFRRTGELATIDGKVCTISPNAAIETPSSPGGRVDRYWEKGFLRRQGLVIPVMKWVDTDAQRFILRDVPPDEWLLAGSSSIDFLPGCHKTIEDCREVWDNEQGINGTVGGGFNGIGFAMVPYNPLFEDTQ